jgi:hypothetical protein
MTNGRTERPATRRIRLVLSPILAGAAALVCALPALGHAGEKPASPRFEASDATLTRAYACLDVLTEKLAHKPAVWGSLYHVLPRKSSFEDVNATFWGWDSAWALASLLPETTEPARVFVVKSLEHQREDGEVPTTFNYHRVSYYWNGANAFLILTVSELLKYEGRPDLLRASVQGASVYEREKRACDWYRRHLWDEKLGLYRNYGHAIEDEFASFDTTWDSASDYRGGPDLRNNDFWPDFNTYYALMHREMAWQARLMGDLEYSAEQQAMAGRLEASIEARLWNPAVGMFTDLDEAGRPMTARHCGGIEAALLLKRHVPELVRHLDNPAEFRLPFGIPGLSLDNPRFDPTDSGDHTHGAAMPHHNPRWFQLLLEQGYDQTARAGLRGWMRGKKFDRMPLDGSGHWLYEDLNPLTGEDVRRPWYGLNLTLKRTLWQGVLGIYPRYEGLTFEPRLDALGLSWARYRMSYRGAELDLDFQVKGQPGSPLRVSVDGTAVSGTSIPDSMLPGPHHRISIEVPPAGKQP